MTTFTVRGVEEQGAAAAPPSLGAFGGVVEVKDVRAVRVGEMRGATSEVLTAGADDVLELHLDDGIRLWTSPERLEEMMHAAGMRGPGAGLALPRVLQFGPRTRGGAGRALRLLPRVSVKLNLKKLDVAGNTARVLAEELERKLEPAAGLYRWNQATLHDPVTDGAGLPGGVPLLVFLHGTASNTVGSFGGLRATGENNTPNLAEKVWSPLDRNYRGNVLALEHRTLSVSPIQNAIDLVRALPEDAVLHLVSHSRGGLVGELLCRAQAAAQAPFGPEVEARFRKRGRENLDEFARLQELARAVKERNIRVERFVRVAAPARGTTLASRRLDLWLSVMVNVVGLIPGLRGNPVYEFLTALTLGVVRTRTDPRDMPGLEAMMPTSPLIGFLNESPVQKNADLSVIAGDTQGSGSLKRLLTLATDLFYRENHDLVVNTGSMVGGIPRAEKTARFFFAKGGEVSHFGYFGNEGTAHKLLTALTRPDTPGEFELITAKSAEQLKTRAPEAAPGTERPVVILVPGFMGSELWLPARPGAPDGTRVWIDMAALGDGGFADLAVNAPGSDRVEARALLAQGYGALQAYLGATHEVVPFPYDWRLSLLDAARRLAEVVAERLGRTSAPVRLLAHSTGGLVARAMIAQNPGLWRRVTERPGGRLVMLGTPHGGLHRVLRLLLGQEPLAHGLELVDRKHTVGDLLQVMARFPGVLELLPAGQQPDLFTPQAWAALRGAVPGAGDPPAASLAAARALHETLAREPLDARGMVSVAGAGHLTPFRFQVEPEAVRFDATLQGDGWVSWGAWTPDDLRAVRPWYAAGAEHGELARWPRLFPAIADLLQTGTTTRELLEQPPAALRGGEQAFVLRDQEAAFFPGEAELAGAALGFEPRERPDEAAEEPLKVRVVHGNLNFVRHPIAVGHYAGDTINGAEKVVDGTLDGRLSERRKLRLYPGPLATAAVFLCEEPTLRGAIVVGLGEVGTLTGARLERSFTHAVLEYASAIAERQPCGAGADEQVRAAGLATLLIGSGRGGINLEDSVRALLRGAVEARRLLAGSRLATRVRIDTLEFWELYEDLAIQAIRVVRRLAAEERNPARLVDETLVSRVGGRRRASFGVEQDWWDRMAVTLREGEMVYETPTSRARVERRSVRRQKRLVDQFVSTVINDVTGGHDVARTLFELLIPNDLKDYEPDRNALILVLDATTARFPWELLHNPLRDRPQAVERGLIRQFATSRFRQTVSTPINNAVLVVGNPQDTGFADLPGAEQETRMATELLRARKFDVTALIGADATFPRILNALFAGSYRILHIAAHGVHRYLTPAQVRRAKQRCRKPAGVSGVVVGRGVFLTSAEVEQMRSVPEVVFINCCNTGAIDPDDPARSRPGALAASLAEQLIKMGVRAVVAAGWPVEDQAAVTFAETFYTRMLAGDAFGEAVHGARRATYDRHPETNTWGAYQCYGDHGFVLERAGSAPYAPPPDLDFSCMSDVMVALENLASDAGTASQFRLRTLREQLAAIQKKVGRSWRNDAPVVAALAHAHAQVGHLAAAICHYRRLAAREKARYSVEALEQLANLESRWAVQRYKRQVERGRTVNVEAYRRQIRRALARLRRLHSPRGRSSERWSLIGSAHKRLSQLEPTPQSTVGRLAKMRDSYQKAHEIALARRGSVNPYPTRNWLAARVMAHYLAPEPGFADWRNGEFERWMRSADEATQVDEVQQPDFWSGAAITDGELIRYLAHGTLPHHVDDIVHGYHVAWRRGGPELSLRSVVENLEWVIDILTPTPVNPGVGPASPTPAGTPPDSAAAAAADADAGPAAEMRDGDGVLPSAHGEDPSAATGEAPQGPVEGEAGEGSGPAPESPAAELNRIVEALMAIRGRVLDFLNEPGASQPAGR